MWKGAETEEDQRDVGTREKDVKDWMGASVWREQIAEDHETFRRSVKAAMTIDGY